MGDMGMPEYIIKRDGRKVAYEEAKIAGAILRAFEAADSAKGSEEAQRLAHIVTREVNRDESIDVPTVEGVQDTVEKVLIGLGRLGVALVNEDLSLIHI